MKKRYMNENVHKSGVYSHRSERSSSSNVLQELNCNKGNLTKLNSSSTHSPEKTNAL